jgi:hypothetical protein
LRQGLTSVFAWASLQLESLLSISTSQVAGMMTLF